MPLACIPPFPRINELVYCIYVTTKPVHPWDFTIMKVTQGNWKKTEIHVLYKSVQKITDDILCGGLNNMPENGKNGIQITFQQNLWKTLWTTQKSIYGLKKNKPYYESVRLQISTAWRILVLDQFSTKSKHLMVHTWQVHLHSQVKQASLQFICLIPWLDQQPS